MPEGFTEQNSRQMSGKLIHETQKAYRLLLVDEHRGDSTEVWIPKSQVEIQTNKSAKTGETRRKIFVKLWWIEKEQLEQFQKIQG